MTDRNEIVRDLYSQGWAVYLTGEFPRYCATFPSLLEAENYVTERPDEGESA